MPNRLQVISTHWRLLNEAERVRHENMHSSFFALKKLTMHQEIHRILFHSRNQWSESRQPDTYSTEKCNVLKLTLLRDSFHFDNAAKTSLKPEQRSNLHDAHEPLKYLSKLLWIYEGPSHSNFQTINSLLYSMHQIPASTQDVSGIDRRRHLPQHHHHEMAVGQCD